MTRTDFWKIDPYNMDHVWQGYWMSLPEIGIVNTVLLLPGKFANIGKKAIFSANHMLPYTV